MPAAPIPKNEHERLERLHSLGILDTPTEDTFDRITGLVASMLDVPAATLSLVDSDRQWFKSCVGMDVRETHRDHAFCAHAILDDEPLVVCDALDDERFADNPLVKDEGIRFYAGVPLVTSSGHRVGALCAIDFEPREIGDTELNILSSLAKTAIELLEARQEAAAARKQTAELMLAHGRFEMLSKATQDVVWDLNPSDGTVWWNENIQTTFGYPPERVELSVDWWTSLIHPDDRERVGESFHAAIDGTELHWDEEYQFLHADGHYVPVFDRGYILRDDAGRAIRVLGAMLDLSETKKREQLMRQHNFVVASSNVVVFRWLPEPGWPVDLVSENVSQFGYDADDFLEGRLVFDDILHPEDVSRVADEIHEYVAQRAERYDQEYRIVCRNGEIRWVYDHTTAERNEAGEITHYQGIIIDITDRKRTELALRESEERLRRIASQVPGAVYLFRLETDGTQCIRYISDGVVDVCGMTPSEIYQDPSLIRKRILLDDLEKFDESILESSRTMEPWMHEFRIRHPDGSVRWVCGNSIPQQEPDGTVVWHGIITDVSERKEAENEKRRLTAMVEVSADFIGLADAQGRAVYINSSGKHMLGISQDEDVHGMPVSNFHPPWAAEIIAKEGVPTAIREGHWIGETALRSRDGKEIPVSQLITAHKQSDGSVEYLSTVMRDITVQKQHAAIEAARHKAEAANHAKSQFLANMSHEIRSPMMAILGSAELLLDEGQAAADQREAVEVIQRNGSHLLAVVSDILDLSKIEAGVMVLERIPCSVSELVADVAAFARIKAQEKGLQFDLVANGKIPALMTSDPTRLRQILINLTGNAVKFTDKGSVRLTVDMPEPATHDAPRIRFTITDTGIGMSQDQIASLFKPFVQADSTTTRRYGGTGLGLVISHRLAEALGGEISVESTPGCGSVFTVTVETGSLAGIPLLDNMSVSLEQSASQQTRDVCPPSAAVHGRILLAEDAIDNQNVLRAYLERAGLDVVVASNGRIVCNLVAKSLAANDDKPFDAVLMDMQMPEMDGYEATAALRTMGYKGPIIALTAHAMVNDRDKCYAAGCNEYLTKPIKRAHLVTAVQRVLSEQAALQEPCEQVAEVLEDEAILDEFRASFLTTLPEDVARIESLVEQNNLQELAKTVHRLAGTSGMYQYDHVSQAASRVEDMALLPSAIDEIDREVQLLLKLIRAVPGYGMCEERTLKRDAADKRKPPSRRKRAGDTPNTLQSKSAR